MSVRRGTHAQGEVGSEEGIIGRWEHVVLGGRNPSVGRNLMTGVGGQVSTPDSGGGLSDCRDPAQWSF